MPRLTGAASGRDAASFEGLLEAAAEAMVGLDRSGVIRFVNPQAEALFGYDGDVLVGQLVEILIPEAFWPDHLAQREGYVRS